MGKLVLTIGLVGLCHAAYSATQHRNYLRLTENEFTRLPLDIILQTLLSLLLSCFGIISIAAQFKPIQITSEWENKIWDNIANRTSFYSYNHRGKYLFSSSSSSLTSLNEQEQQEQIEQDQLRQKLNLIREKKEKELLIQKQKLRKEQEAAILLKQQQQQQSKSSSDEGEEDEEYSGEEEEANTSSGGPDTE